MSSADKDGRIAQAMRDRMTCGAMEINQAIVEGFAALDEGLRRGLEDEGDE